MSETPKQYADRNTFLLGEHFLRHMSAMTGEKLHGKFEIAAELAWRDQQIAAKGAEVERLRALITCGCGDMFTAHDPGTCGRCRETYRYVRPNDYGDEQEPTP